MIILTIIQIVIIIMRKYAKYISNKSENKNEKIIANNTNESESVNEDDRIIVEIIYPKLLKKFYDDCSNDINININIDINNRQKKSKLNQLILYKREIGNCKRKNEKIEKEKNKIIND